MRTEVPALTSTLIPMLACAVMGSLESCVRKVRKQVIPNITTSHMKPAERLCR